MAVSKVELGDLVQDKITLFKGIAIQNVEYINGCNRIAVQPQGLNKDGKIFDCGWFDLPSLKIVKKQVVKRGSKATGGATTPVPNKVNPK